MDAPMIPSGMSSDGSGNATTPTASQTEIKVEKVTHNWTVKNFSHCYQEYLENFVYLNKGDETLTWSVKIYPKGNGENNKDFVFLCLNRVTPSNASAATAGKFGKIGFKSRFIMKTAESKEIEMRVHPNPSHSDYVSYIKRDVLFPQILPQDVIIVSVEIDVATETVTTSSEDSFSVPDSDRQLIEDYQRLLKEGENFSDFVIRIDNREIKVHRAILASRSTVFNAMLMHDTEEANNGYVEIKDLEYEIVLEMLNFIYCGRCPRLSELGGELLVAADKYSLGDLKLHCEKALINALHTENACELLILADVHSARRLRERAVEFILAHSYQITSTPGWQLMLSQHSRLVTEVFQHFHKPGGNNSPAGSAVGGPPKDFPVLTLPQ
jgi:hypothetical protein